MNIMDKIFAFIEHVPTTRIRILVTIGLIVATTITWLMHSCDMRTPQGICVGWEPSSNMIIFLAALAGVDVAQYVSKGIIGAKAAPVSTSPIEEPQEEPTVESTTDISELSEQEKG